ncbi:MAG: phage tail sheath C-terminal domain-containing protein [Ilumatobacter sp.]|uniref:phage tail sheath family protein n=1 Tax=Ilumatobacter sp. TaxID=1967498 RepID=UPI0026300EFA|nr:phage tail sheath C-terminal domain-containing protein [Ilumatobacter sp.]MDJ0768467.1 phage tail sheath C-terminal domain-containing protein [Ilumatobacter sp.]
MPTYKTPGVFVEEISVFPPSVAEVETAVPAFVGYTEKHDRKGVSLLLEPTRIKSLVEYRELFGGGARPDADKLKVTLNADLEPQTVEFEPTHLLYYALQLFYANGGGPCYIVSVGTHDDDIDNTELTAGINAVAKYDEPTMILFPDGIKLDNADQFAGLQTTTLSQCQTLMDRIGVFDIREVGATFDADVSEFRTKVGNNALKYGAAYAPHLETIIPVNYRFDDIQLVDSAAEEKSLTELSTAAGIDTTTAGAAALDGSQGQEAYELAIEDLKATNSIYAAVAAAIAAARMTLPPSPAVAGVMAKVDRTRGVWKSPANVSLNLVAKPTVRIDDAIQDGLNVDANAGKSVNAIRTFAGKGIYVWGARTLAGNDNEWRYVSVRRFYNMVEESVKKSTGWAVFEPNAAPLWVKVKAMIENYLSQKWREGALAGAVADDAFFVKVGLGETMSAQDILEGRLIVEIGMAAVRPAEFIILRFSHKMQES